MARPWRPCLLADAHAGGVVAVGAVGRRAAGADPLLAALVAALLLLEALLQLLHDLVPAAERLDLGLLLVRQIELGHRAQPLLRDLRLQRLAHQLEALEDVAEHLVELVEVALVLHQRGAGEIVEVLDAAIGQVRLHRLHQGEVLLQGDRHLGGFQLMEEGGEHRILSNRSTDVIPAKAGTQATLPQGAGCLLGAAGAQQCLADNAPLRTRALGSRLRGNDAGASWGAPSITTAGARPQASTGHLVQEREHSAFWDQSRLRGYVLKVRHTFGDRVAGHPPAQCQRPDARSP